MAQSPGSVKEFRLKSGADRTDAGGMSKKPLAFGIRCRVDDRTLTVRGNERDRRYTSEVRRRGQRPERRDHASLADALRSFAHAWRQRLH